MPRLYRLPEPDRIHLTQRRLTVTVLIALFAQLVFSAASAATGDLGGYEAGEYARIAHRATSFGGYVLVHGLLMYGVVRAARRCDAPGATSVLLAFGAASPLLIALVAVAAAFGIVADRRRALLPADQRPEADIRAALAQDLWGLIHDVVRVARQKITTGLSDDLVAQPLTFEGSSPPGSRLGERRAAVAPSPDGAGAEKSGSDQGPSA